MAAGAAVLLAGACTGDEGQPAPEPEQQSTPDDPSETADATPGEETGTGKPGDAPVSEASGEPDSIHVLVNKAEPLDPLDYEPEDLTGVDIPQRYGGQQMREEPAGALEELFAAAAQEDLELEVTTAYRDYAHQQALYDSRYAEQGQEATDELTARPGHSEHQTGLAVDLSFPGNEDCYLSTCFGETEQGQWLGERAWEFGFIIRYPEGAEETTGFDYEPWHLRYVGEETAEAVVEEGTTLEEYWDQSAAPEYETDYDG